MMQLIPPTLRRLAAFTDTPEGGNPAGVWIGHKLPSPAEMQRIAAEVGYSETAFLAPARGTERTIRYYSPEAEVSFCGHATIAAGVALADSDGDGTYRLATAAGEVSVHVTTGSGQKMASLTSVPPRWEPAGESLMRDALAALGWAATDLDLTIPPARAYAGAWHLVLAARSYNRLASLDYAFDRLKQVMLADGLTTVQLVWREHEDLYHARNPFPVGGVVEDPATGAAAAAFGGYLRDGSLRPPPFSFVIRQGEAIGRPSQLRVHVPVTGGISVSGTAADLE